MREWTKGTRRRSGLQRYASFLLTEGVCDTEVSYELANLLESQKGLIAKLLIEGYDRREIAAKMSRSVGWVQREISRLLMVSEMQEIIQRHKKMIK